MPRATAWDDEEWDEGYGDSEDEEPTIPCPYCRSEIHEDSQRCPHCEQYISEEDAPPERKPWRLVAGVAFCLFLVFVWVVRG